MNERIEINPRVCGGQPVIKGTRISVTAILEGLAEDESWESLLRGYPELTRADIQAALDYARRSILHTEIEAVVAAWRSVRLYLDQMLRVELAGLLRSAGHDVIRASEVGQARADDALILERAV